MSEWNWCRVGIVLAERDQYAGYYLEVLHQAGFRADPIERPAKADWAEYDVVLLCGYGTLTESALSALELWIKSGGCVVASGSAWSAEVLLGLTRGARHASYGRIVPKTSGRHWPSDVGSAKFFGAKSHDAVDGDVRAELDDGGVGVSYRAVGLGKTWFVATHVGQTIAQMQFGRSVETDGIGPSDRTARLDDGVLRAEDGSNLDFDRDRITTPDCATPFFGQAHADAIREIWLRAAVEAMAASRKPFVGTWQWPGQLNAVGMLTIDCPAPSAEGFSAVSRIVMNIGGRPAWIVGQSGFSSEVYRGIQGSLQEVGVLYQPPESQHWDAEKLRIQHLALSRTAASQHVDAIRAGDGAWEGYMEPYEMAAKAGARMVIAKGGRQLGTAGFLFGTCLPTRPMRRDGTFFETFDMSHSAFVPTFPDGAAETIVGECVRRNGCFHIATELESLESPKAQDSLRRLIMLAKQEGIKFLLPSEIAHHQEQRRDLRIHATTSEDGAELCLTSSRNVAGMTVLVGGLEDFDASMAGNPVKTQGVQRFGAHFWSMTFHLEAKRSAYVRLANVECKAA